MQRSPRAAKKGAHESTGGQAGDDDDDRTCCICMDAPLEVVLVPCGHVKLCFECARQLKATAREDAAQFCCPFCRVPVKSFLRVYL